jgi:hypothetical protein
MRRDAKVFFEGHEQFIGCVVHDISNGGARLSFTVPLAVLPRTFTLVLFKDCVQGDCELVWRDREVVGAKFISQMVRHQIIRARVRLQKLTRRGAA